MDSQKIGTKVSAFFSGILKFLSQHKIPAATVSVLTALCIITATAIALTENKKPAKVPKTVSEVSASEPTESSEPEPPSVSETAEASSAESKVSETVRPAPAPAPAKKSPAAAKKPAVTAAPVSGYQYNTNSDIDDNIFLDALIYTGYNIKKHRADGKMWQYILAANKRGLGYLSRITYGGGSSGYETAGGRSDIKYFEKHGLVCASYVTYVYFNYLPNVAGIDTSALPKPARPTSANDWYTALKQWISKGYSRRISFTASKTSAGFIRFKPSENIPIGSLIVFCDAKKRSDFGSHVAIYAGYKNNYHWLFHVGNKNGPEFCAVERMHFGPDPQWPIAVITPPSNIRMSALLEISVTDNSGAPVQGAAVSVKNSKTGAEIKIGTTGGSGRLSKEGLSYGDYQLRFTVPDGYTAGSTVQNIKLTTAGNSKNTVRITVSKKPAEPPAVSSSESSGTDTPESSKEESSGGESAPSGSGENTPSTDETNP